MLTVEIFKTGVGTVINKRKVRKNEHIQYSMLLEKELKRNTFKDITILHNCLSEVNLDDINLSTNLQDIKLKSPIIINAITGSTPEGKN